MIFNMSEEAHISEADLEKALKEAGMTEEEFSGSVPVQPIEQQLSKEAEKKYESLNEKEDKQKSLSQAEIDQLLAGLNEGK